MLLDIVAHVTSDVEPLDWSLAIQCPSCASTDVALEATDLLARVQDSTTES
ncbi:hypothetical protein [Haladaptatus sp. DFWS20]|uniref:hypothetical protein n=1 Tax=Haladaptatus sp. DFWS20 TaxID=3403467 RepID=UPI003EBFCDEE